MAKTNILCEKHRGIDEVFTKECCPYCYTERLMEKAKALTCEVCNQTFDDKAEMFDVCYNCFFEAFAAPKLKPLSELIAELEYATKRCETGEKRDQWKERDKWLNRVTILRKLIEQRYREYDEPEVQPPHDLSKPPENDLTD